MVEFVVALLAGAVIAVYFWKATRPLRQYGDMPTQCSGCPGCSGTNSVPETCPNAGKTLYGIDHVSKTDAPEES